MSVEEKKQLETFEFSSKNLDKAQKIIAQYPTIGIKSAVMPLLDLAQRQNGGWLSRETMKYVANMLSMPLIRVYEVANFYTMYNLEPIGKYHVQVCTNISCLLRGSDKIMQQCKKTLGIGHGETTDDGNFTLREVECLGACVNAPMMQINYDYYEGLDAQGTEKILDTLKSGQTPTPGPQSNHKKSKPTDFLTGSTKKEII